MPTRTFIGFILLVFAMLIASTPALLDPLSLGAQKGLDAAGVPGMSPDATFATRAEREDTGTVKDTLQLKGYEVGESDMQDIYSPSDREEGQLRVNGRTTSGSRRAALPGSYSTSDPMSPPVRSSGGVLLDKAGCPVFRAGLDLPTLWKDPTQQKKYLDKAASADDPAICRQRLEALVNNATASTTLDEPTSRHFSRIRRSDDLALGIMIEQITLMDEMFPTTAGANGGIIRAGVAAEAEPTEDAAAPAAASDD